MRVICPFTNIRPETRESLDASGYAWEAIDVSGADEAYWEALSDLWEYQETFAVVEHDIVLREGVLAELEACSGLWCTCPYPYQNGMRAGLGCVRFDRELITGYPRLMEDVATFHNTLHPHKHWCTLDAWMELKLTGRGYTKCLHDPVGHLNPERPTHRCV